MNWKKLFAKHILERGYDYYCENAVENLDISDDVIRADVIGTEDYEVEISLNNGEVTDMYCSCPYALDGRNCKHMAAVLYEWSENDIDENEDKEMGTNNYIRQVDIITNRYLGREHFISYYEAGGFISELEDIISEDVRRMIDNGNYLSAFEVMNYIFVLIGDVDMDDSDGGIGMLADSIYQLWLELLAKVSPEEKRKMFGWFTSHLDGSVIDYLEEYIEQIIMEEFKEKEYEQDKIEFIQNMIEKARQNTSDWSRDYGVGKWAVRYLDMLKKKKAPEKQIEEVCKKYWSNSTVRRYYIDMYMKKKEYDYVLQVLHESMLLDKQYRGLISEYSKMKKEIYLLQGNKSAYIEQLWELVLDHEAGNLDLYKELKKQYSAEEWLVKREEIFKKLPAYAHVERFYKEEQLYDRLLEYVLNSPGLYALQEYENVLKKEYPEQVLVKYQDEVNKMALHTSDRKHYASLVSFLRRMQKINGGLKVVEQIVADWKVKYKNRPAMMDELRKL